MTEWFRTWFDTPYYALLYQRRGPEEAQAFLANLLRNLQLPVPSRVIDLACGSGRYSLELARLGHHVTGIDLSQRRIQQAIATAHDEAHALSGTVKFLVADMRQLGFNAEFDLALNLFTSLGYFRDLAENQQVLQRTAQALRPGGVLVIDFLNARHVTDTLVPQEVQQVGGVRFEIRRRIENGQVHKSIRVTDGETMQHFTEQVQLLTYRDFERLLKKAQLTLETAWGDYLGAPFNEERSERLILFARKPD
ncbi:MAG: class I SAM-dependent methyltransferase [Bacteroidia bacterium]|nr:class I SAM-dependent methyltransferase [Bacteroidia bacterium]